MQPSRIADPQVGTTATTTETAVTSTASPLTVELLWEGSFCSPLEPWLGFTNTAEECAKLCMESPKPYPMSRIVWVKNGDKACACAADDCIPSDWQWGAVYRFYSGTPTTVMTTVTSTSTTSMTPTSTSSTGDWVLVQSPGACRGANLGDNSAAYYVVISATSLEEWVVNLGIRFILALLK